MTVAEQIEAETQLGDALKDYAGKWVAVREHVVVAHADTLKALLEQIAEQEVEAVLEVPEDHTAVCFF
jgi:hypothetical protein